MTHFMCILTSVAAPARQPDAVGAGVALDALDAGLAHAAARRLLAVGAHRAQGIATAS